MSADTGSSRNSEVDDLHEEIDRTRDDLGDTVEEIAAKADVKGRAQAKVAQVKEQAAEKKEQTKQAAGHLKEQAATSVRDTAKSGARTARENAPAIGVAGVIIAAAGGTVIAVLLRRRANRRTRWQRVRHTAGELASTTADRLHATDLAARTGGIAGSIGDSVRSSDTVQAAAGATAEQTRRLARSHRAQGAAAATTTLLVLEGLRRKRRS